ncbi:hypothetical protein Tco_1408891 [Tanacetum coccineum]
MDNGGVGAVAIGDFHLALCAVSFRSTNYLLPSKADHISLMSAPLCMKPLEEERQSSSYTVVGETSEGECRAIDG